MWSKCGVAPACAGKMRAYVSLCVGVSAINKGQKESDNPEYLRMRVLDIVQMQRLEIVV